MDVFKQKIDMRAECFLEKGRLFLTKYRHEKSDFFEKIGKKDILLTFYPIIWCSFERIDVLLTKFLHVSRQFFMKKIEKIT